MNRKGFTLIELIATIVILGLVVAISGFTISSLITSSKEKNYDLLIKDIIHASELYYQECTYMAKTEEEKDNSGCVASTNGAYSIPISTLVNFGYLKDNGEDANSKIIINPKTDDILTDCTILISYSDGAVVVTKNDSLTKCPGEYK